MRAVVPLAALLLACLPPAAGAAAPAPYVQPSQWLTALAQQRLAPGYTTLAGRVDALAEALDAACAGQPEAAAAARERWREAALSLRALSPLPFGPVLETRVLRRIDFWPTRPAQIERSIAQYAAKPQDTARIGLSARGLPAIEYLLFDAGRASLAEDAAACRYTAWLAHDAAAAVHETAAAWPAWVDGLAEADAERDAQLIRDGINILIGSTEVLRLKYLEKPLRHRAGPPETDAWRSGAGRAALTAYFDGLRVGLQGGEGLYGLTAVMRGRGLLVLADRLDTQITATAAALAALPEDFGAEAARPAAEALMTELGRLQRLLAEDVADAMKVTVGFGESDGD
ncbi:imelysin family protein [Pseudothauera rhizosphaerae]|uniref:Imelysin-like domain-containing protein n=1 Tax=Pseudothauera rhizosphaerae TaxID=2565932 RepID=A0A4S4ADL3_9RHOO|nr:imelysin family protein [Pseudothauera rhizosphaerae]THF56852.1 hypothetical protein E6O51_18635 [Pseudothauera rhizosphaerae]